MKKKIFTIILSLCAGTLLGNVGHFDGFGANLRLVKNNDIQMQSEVVRITPIAPKSAIDGSMKTRVWAEYDCEFILKNLSDKEVEIQVGFPLASYDYVKDKPRATENRDFKVLSTSLDYNDIKSYKFDYVSKDKDQKFRDLFYWDMTFMPKESKKVNITYKLAGYYGLGVTAKNPKEYNEDNPYGDEMTGGLCQMFGYVTKTGNSWAGEIESAKFIFDLKDFEAKMDKGEVFKIEKPKKEIHRDNVLLQMLSEGQWTRFLNPEFEEDKEGNYSATFAPFKPMEDFELIYFSGAFPKDLEGLERLFSLMENSAKKGKSLLKKFNLNIKKNIAGIILAYYGIEVDNPEISSFIEKQRYHKAKFHPQIDEALKAKLLDYPNWQLNKENAIQIAEEKLLEIYGERVLKKKPWSVEETDKSFIIKGTLPPMTLGGVPEIEISKADGSVISYKHGK